MDQPDWMTELTNFDGTQIRLARFKDDTDPQPITLLECARHALADDVEEEKRDGEKKWADWFLAHKITEGKELTKAEITRVKKRIGMRWPAAIVGPAWMLLDPPKD